MHSAMSHRGLQGHEKTEKEIGFQTQPRAGDVDADDAVGVASAHRGRCELAWRLLPCGLDGRSAALEACKCLFCAGPMTLSRPLFLNKFQESAGARCQFGIYAEASMPLVIAFISQKKGASENRR